MCGLGYSHFKTFGHHPNKRLPVACEGWSEMAAAYTIIFILPTWSAVQVRAREPVFSSIHNLLLIQFLRYVKGVLIF